MFWRRTVPVVAFSLLLQLPTLAQDWQTQTSDPHKMFIKFKDGTRLLKLVREPREQVSKSNVQQQVSELNSFQATLGIVRLRAVKPDATLERLPGGIERLFVASFADSVNMSQALDTICSSGEVEYAEPIYTCDGGDVQVEFPDHSQSAQKLPFFPDDPQFPNQWGLHNTGQFNGVQNGLVGADINALMAWEITTGSSNIMVAFLASGLALRAVEFSGRDYQGYNFVGDNHDVTDDNWLGTLVTGISAAKGNNGWVIAGVDWKCRILPVKVVNANYQTSSDWTVLGLTYAADKAANVICVPHPSWAYKAGSALNDALTYATSKGSIIVACGAPGWGYFNSYPPASDKIILVGSVDGRNKRLTTAYGRVDFMAPGERIYGLSAFDPNFPSFVSGPIAATALVTGVVSLMLSIDNSLTFQDVYGILKETASDQVGWPYEDTPGWDQYHGWGSVNAYRALRLILNRTHSRLPVYFGASQNYPNPLKRGTMIEYDIPKMSDLRPMHVTVKIYDVLGRIVATLVDEVQEEGYHYTYWNANVPSGVYFYRLEAEDFVRTCKMIVVR